jgi:hypothetical protein
MPRSSALIASPGQGPDSKPLQLEYARYLREPGAYARNRSRGSGPRVRRVPRGPRPASLRVLFLAKLDIFFLFFSAPFHAKLTTTFASSTKKKEKKTDVVDVMVHHRPG